MAGDLVSAVKASAARLGVNPSDLLTAMSYETGGTLDPNLWGGKGGKYLGLIQFGPEEQAKYGVKPGMSAADQVNAAEDFLRDRGVKPGMGLLDIYSTINAGKPGLYDRSDASNGGAPGTVADKVATQMVGHRARANALLGGSSDDDSTTPASGASPEPPTPASPSAASVPVAQQTPDAGSLLPSISSAIGKVASQQQAPQPTQIDTPLPPGLPAAQRLAAIMQRLQVTPNGSQ
jgi:hypothetical protein